MISNVRKLFIKSVYKRFEVFESLYLLVLVITVIKYIISGKVEAMKFKNFVCER